MGGQAGSNLVSLLPHCCIHAEADFQIQAHSGELDTSHIRNPQLICSAQIDVAARFPKPHEHAVAKHAMMLWFGVWTAQGVQDADICLTRLRSGLVRLQLLARKAWPGPRLPQHALNSLW